LRVKLEKDRREQKNERGEEEIRAERMRKIEKSIRPRRQSGSLQPRVATAAATEVFAETTLAAEAADTV